MSRRTAVVVAGALGFLLGGRLFAEQQERPSTVGTLAGVRRTPQGLTNDNCVDAIPIFNNNTDFDTTGANTDGLPHSQCQFDGQTYHDIWYNYEAPCSVILTVSTCNQANYDTDLVVYDGCFPDIPCPPGDEHLLDCNDDFSDCAGFSSEVTVPIVAGNCYMIRMGGWNDGDMGTATVTLTLHCGHKCGDGVCGEGENPCNCPIDCPGECLCTLFANPAEFEAFNEQQGLILKGIETFEESVLPPGTIDAMDDPLCGGVPSAPDAFPYPNGLTQLNMCVQSNTLGANPTSPSPAGVDGLDAISAGFLGITSDVVLSGTFIYSMDLMFGEPVPPENQDNHTAVGFDTVAMFGGGTVDVRIYNTSNDFIGTAPSPADSAGSNFFGVSCTVPIGRINIRDVGNGAEGADNIQMWLPADGNPCGDCPTDVDGSGDTGAADLAVLLGSWGSCSPGDPCECIDADSDGVIGAADLAVLLGSWGPCG